MAWQVLQNQTDRSIKDKVAIVGMGYTRFGELWDKSASGLRMLYEMYLQLQDRAEKRQIKNPRLGLTHNLGGTTGGMHDKCLYRGIKIG